jgi:hypothetical protein
MVRTAPGHPLRRWQLYIIMIWLCFVSILASGYRDQVGANHPLQLLLVQKLHDPTLYPNDVFVKETVYAYASWLWYIVARLSQFANLSVVLGVLFIVVRLLLLLAAYWLARNFFPQSGAAPIAAMAFMATSPSPLIGAGNPIRDFTEQTSFAVAFVLLAFAAFMQRRPLLTALWLGLAMDMNMMYALFGLVYLFVAWGSIAEYRKDWRAWLAAAPVLILSGTPGLWLTITKGTRQVEDLAAVWKVAEMQFPYHFFPPLWPVPIQLFVVGLMLFSWWLAGKVPFVAPGTAVHLRIWALVGFGWYLLAWLTPYVLHSLTLLRLHPIRGHDLWLLGTGIFFAAAAAAWIETRLSRVPWRFALQTALLTVSILWLRIYFFRVSGFIQMVAIFLFSGLLAAVSSTILARTRSLTITSHLLASVAVLIAVTILSLRGLMWHAERVIAAENWLGIAPTPCYAVAEWARNATRREDVFLVPVGPDEGWQEFRHLSQRNVFVHWKDGTAWPYAPWYAAEWLRRMQLLGLMEIARLDKYQLGSWIYVRKNYSNKIYRNVDEKRVMQLAKQYRIDYWITYQDMPTQLPIVYQHGDWKVVRIR